MPSPPNEISRSCTARVPENRPSPVARCGGWANVAFPHAQQRPAGAKPYRVGVLNEAFGPNPPVVLGLKAGLAEFGLQEGRDVVFETVLTRGQLEALPVEDSTKFEL